MNIFREMDAEEDGTVSHFLQGISSDVALITAFGVSTSSSPIETMLDNCVLAVLRNWSGTHISERLRDLIRASPDSRDPVTAFNISVTMLYTVLWDDTHHDLLINTYNLVYLSLQSFWRIHQQQLSPVAKRSFSREAIELLSR